MSLTRQLIAPLLIIASTNVAAANEPVSPLLIGSAPLTIDRLKTEFGNRLAKSPAWCSERGAPRDDGQPKCDSWVVENVTLQVKFDSARYVSLANDGIVDVVELTRSGGCDDVLGAYESLAGAARLNALPKESDRATNRILYRIAGIYPHLKETTVELWLEPRRCSLTYRFIGKR